MLILLEFFCFFILLPILFLLPDDPDTICHMYLIFFEIQSLIVGDYQIKQSPANFPLYEVRVR